MERSTTDRRPPAESPLFTIPPPTFYFSMHPPIWPIRIQTLNPQFQIWRNSSPVVLSIECLKGTSKADKWTDDMLQTGDIVEELCIGTSVTVKSPFKNGRSGVQKILHAVFKAKDTSIQVRVRGGQDDLTELQACIVPDDSAGKKPLASEISA